jgi:DNA-binding MarR family transcriptional regulator
MTEAADHDQKHRPRNAALTVRVSDRDVAEARRLLTLLADADARPPDEGASEASGPGCTSAELLARAQAILAARRRRESIFKTILFGEPAWEMLLLLYLNASRSRLTMGRLGEIAGLSKSTALRWIDYLDREGLARRDPHPTDKRATFVELTPMGRRALDHYLSGIALLTE